MQLDKPHGTFVADLGIIPRDNDGINTGRYVFPVQGSFLFKKLGAPVHIIFMGTAQVVAIGVVASNDILSVTISAAMPESALPYNKNANSNALVVATSALQAVHQVGMPEARIILAHAATYIARSPKSNAAYLGINKALEDVENKDTGTIPMHIRNAPVDAMQSEGYGVGYKYPHDYPNHQVEQQYLPDKMLGTKYYEPDETEENFE